MVVKKAGGKIYGAVLTSAEKKAMNMEIERQLAEYTRKHEVELNAMILYVLHEQLGFGEQRLRKFFDRFSVEIDALVKYYEMDDEDAEWLCTRKLLDMGIDVEKWCDESRNIGGGTFAEHLNVSRCSGRKVENQGGKSSNVPPNVPPPMFRCSGNVPVDVPPHLVHKRDTRLFYATFQFSLFTLCS